MRSIRKPLNHARIPKTAVIVLTTLLLALALSVIAVTQVLKEYYLLGEWLARPGAVSDAEIEALRGDIEARITVRSLASAALMLCTLATLWLQQRQLAIRRAFDEAKLISHEVLHSLDDGVITTDPRGVVTSINAAAIRLIGTGADCIGRPIGEIASPDVPLEDLRRSLAERRAGPVERELALDRDGQVRRLTASALELKDMRGSTIGGVIHLRDVTERTLMQEQVWRMEQFASLSTMASGLLHEIKNPLTALSIHVELLDERLRDHAPDPQAAELIGVLKAEVRRLANTLSSFRDFTNLDRLRLRSTDVRKVLEDVVRLFSPQASAQGVRLNLLPAEAGLPEVEIDPEKIEQAVLNLVLNALEAMPRGGELNLEVRGDGDRLVLVVSDTGPGIPPEIRDHIFRPYFSTKGNGTGMGLALAEKLIRQHRGRLELRTGPRGTTFAITIPMDGRDRSDGQP